MLDQESLSGWEGWPAPLPIAPQDSPFLFGFAQQSRQFVSLILRRPC
jgi:hypothetical protein